MTEFKTSQVKYGPMLSAGNTDEDDVSEIIAGAGGQRLRMMNG
jgi:hypothetical protein